MSEEIVKSAETALAIPAGATLSREALVSAMARWSVAYRLPATIDALSVYYDALSDFRDDDAEAGIRECIRREEYPAPPATVRKYFVSARYARLDREEEARERAEYAEWKRGREASLAAAALREATVASWTSGPTTDVAEALTRAAIKLGEHPSLKMSFDLSAASSGPLHITPREIAPTSFLPRLEKVIATFYVGPLAVVTATSDPARQS